MDPIPDPGIHDPFHAGEREAQARVGVRERMRRRGSAAIRTRMPDQHQAFFGLLPYVLVAALDGMGWPVATVLTGAPGFVSSPDPRTLRISGRPAGSDPAEASLTPGAAVGLLGIDLGTRRRNRVNGRIAASDEAGLTIAVEQSFGNCPQYIQARDVTVLDTEGGAEIPPVQKLDGLDAAARRMVACADTFFVASGSGPRDDPATGVDVSHRGGRPGFVRVEGDVLTIPDFAGNRFYNTLGNLVIHPKVGLLFIDFDAGSLLHLCGEAEIVWDGAEAEGFQGAERLWRVRVSHGWRRAGALPLRWRFREMAPTTERTGTWR